MVICPYCHNEASFVDNAEIYGRRYGKSYMAWWCKPCDARVGVHHNNPDKPLGTMANEELRNWRRKAHMAFDPIWKTGSMTRGGAYEWLKIKFGREIHIGQSDIAVCKRIIELVNDRTGKREK